MVKTSVIKNGLLEDNYYPENNNYSSQSTESPGLKLFTKLFSVVIVLLILITILVINVVTSHPHLQVSIMP